MTLSGQWINAAAAVTWVRSSCKGSKQHAVECDRLSDSARSLVAVLTDLAKLKKLFVSPVITLAVPKRT